MRCNTVVLAMALAVTSPTVAHPQQIELEQVLVLDAGIDGPGAEALDAGSKIARDSRGRFLAVGGMANDRLSVFGANGAFLRYVGRAGEGPGEYRRISEVVATDQYIHVFDSRTGRRTMLDLDFNVVRTDLIDGNVTAAVPLPRDMLAIYADMPVGGSLGDPFHILSPNGSVRSFGRVEGAVYRSGTSIRPATLGLGSGGRVWETQMLAYNCWHTTSPAGRASAAGTGCTP